MGKKSQSFASIVETIEDCKEIIRWTNRNQIDRPTIIALSLETFYYLKKIDWPKLVHVWNIIDMEEVMHRAFFDSQKATEEWISRFREQQDNYYDRAAQYELDFYLFYHSLVSMRVAHKLKRLFLEKKWTYLVPPIKLVFHSPYFPKPQKNLVNNFIFKTTSVNILKNHGVEIKHCSFFYHFKLKVAPLFAIYLIKYRLLWDMAESIRAKLLGLKSIDKLSKTVAKAPITILTSGWGSNISRILSITEFKNKIEKEKNLSSLNLIWRPEKLKNFNFKKISSNRFYNILIRENIKQGTAYGPKLSMFSLLFWPQYLIRLFSILKPRLIQIFFNRNDCPNLLKELLSHSSIRVNMAYQIFFSYRAIFLTSEILTRVIEKVSPILFIGSDSGAANTRGEILLAQQYNITTLSTPHSYQAYSMPSYHYLADYVLTSGPADARSAIASGVTPEHVVPIGNIHPKRKSVKNMPRTQINIVIASRSRGGRWSNYSSKHDIYDKELRGLLSLLSREEKFKVIIKSHPNGDYHKYYDMLVSELGSGRVTHLAKGWSIDDFDRNCDILVLIGEMPSFFMSALYLNIPIVFIKNTMTKTLENLKYNYRGCCAMVDSNSEALEAIKKIAFNATYRRACLQKQHHFAKNYTVSHPERNLVAILKKII